MSLALPEQLNFDKQIPIDGNCKQEVSIAQAITGPGPYTGGQYAVFNVPRQSGCVLDPANTFLRFRINNRSAANSITINHSADQCVNRMEILYAGNPIETIDNYNQLSAMLLDCQVDPSVRASTLNLMKGCSSGFASVTVAAQAAADVAANGFTAQTVLASQGGTSIAQGPTLTSTAAADTSRRVFSTTLISGVLGSLCRSYIPIFALDSNIQLRITFETAQRLGLWSGGAGSYDVDMLELHCNFIRLSDPVMQMVQAPSYRIYTEAWSNFNSTIVAGTTSVELLIPTRYSSLKTVLLGMRRQATANNAGYTLNPNNRNSYTLTDFCYRLGSLTFPPTKVKGDLTNYVECFEELKKALHAGGNALVPMGILNRTNYTSALSANNGALLDSLFMIGMDLEVYSGKSGSILSGLNTTLNDLYLSAVFGAIADASVFDHFLHYDLVLEISNGMLIPHV